jgi:amino acid adenylation domain-containing protein
MVLLAGFETLLARASGQDDLAVGSPISGRNRTEIEGLIGFFVNTLVLRGSLAGEPTFRDLLGQTREAALAAYLHQEVPFELLVEVLNPRRDLSHHPLFQVLFGLHNLPISETTATGVSFQPWPAERATARFDLALDLQETPEGLHGGLEHASDLFDPTTADRLAGHLMHLLAAVAEDPDLRVHELPLLGEAERHQLAVEWNDAASAGLAGGRLHERFAEWARRRPEGVAVVCGEERVSYGDLWRRALRLAGRLRRRGVGPEVPVGLCAERSIGLIEGILGILAAGGAYVPLDPSYPRPRLESILEQTRVPVLLTHSALVPLLPASGAEVLLLDAADEIGEPLPETECLAGIGGEGRHLAYVIFTSGSTGRPKGVPVPHAGAVHLVERARQRLGFGPEDVWTVVHSFTFDFSVWEIWGALTQGGTLVVVSLEEARSPERLAERVRRERVTVLNLTPAAARALAAVAAPGSLPSLRLLVCGGEAFPRELAEQLLGWGVPLWTFYGPTEATVWAAAGEVRTDSQGTGGAVPLGSPLADHRLYVLASGGREPAPVGVPGELHIAGPGLARGYYGDPVLSAQRFVPDPFGGGRPGDRLYRTGDLVRRLADGTLDFLGRIDHQVKVRGFRIELGEIEAALLAEPGVREAVVVVRSVGSSGDRRIVAYVTGDATAEALRTALRDRLPDYMVPAAFVTLPALPLTPNGKVDRKALPAPEPQNAGAGYMAPRTPLETSLTALWAELLGRERVGASDSFFDLGGHSLLAVRLMARIEQAFGVKLPVSALFEAPAPEQLAVRLYWRETWAQRSPLVRLHAGGTGRPLFVVHPVGGAVFSYVDLARRLGRDRPVYGLQAVAEDGGPATMEELAARYLAAVREAQPEGPWRLAGWSFGAVAAYEMARQIESSGGTVQLLAMIDPSPPQEAPRDEAGETFFLAGFALLGGLAERQVDLVRETLEGLDVDAGIDRLFELGRAEGVLPPDVDKPRLRERFELFRRNMKALQGYVPRPYGGKVTLFRAGAADAPEVEDLTLGWGALARTEDLLFLGDHQSLLRGPALDRLVELLQNDLVDRGSLSGGDRDHQSV